MTDLAGTRLATYGFAIDVRRLAVNAQRQAARLYQQSLRARSRRASLQRESAAMYAAARRFTDDANTRGWET